MIMYAAAIGNTITAVFNAYRLSLSMDFLRCLCGGCRFPTDLVFPLSKVTVVLFHNAFHFSESTHKNLHIGITVHFITS